MCPACSRSPEGLLALMSPRTEASSLERDRCPNETAGLARLRRIDRLCHHASLLSRKLQRWTRRTKPPRARAGSSRTRHSRKKPDVPDLARLLGARRERARSRCTAEQPHERAAFHVWMAPAWQEKM